jgi:hypothetical protein
MLHQIQSSKGIFIELLSGVQGEPTEWNGQLDKEISKT